MYKYNNRTKRKHAITGNLQKYLIITRLLLIDKMNHKKEKYKMQIDLNDSYVSSKYKIFIWQCNGFSQIFARRYEGQIV